jgi:hypothetical protein
LGLQNRKNFFFPGIFTGEAGVLGLYEAGAGGGDLEADLENNLILIIKLLLKMSELP